MRNKEISSCFIFAVIESIWYVSEDVVSFLSHMIDLHRAAGASERLHEYCVQDDYMKYSCL